MRTSREVGKKKKGEETYLKCTTLYVDVFFYFRIFEYLFLKFFLARIWFFQMPKYVAFFLVVVGGW